MKNKLEGNLLQHIYNPTNPKEYLKMYFNFPASTLDNIEDISKAMTILIGLLDIFECKKTRVHFSLEKGLTVEDILQDDKCINYQDHLTAKTLRAIIKRLDAQVVISCVNWGEKQVLVDEELNILDVEETSADSD